MGLFEVDIRGDNNIMLIFCIELKANLQMKALSLNVRGIRTFEKRKGIFNWLISKGQIFAF